jgi:hypothetical protein
VGGDVVGCVRLKGEGLHPSPLPPPLHPLHSTVLWCRSRSVEPEEPLSEAQVARTKCTELERQKANWEGPTHPSCEPGWA